MTIITDVECDVRAARGAALLDERYPGWEFRVDLATLDIGSTRYCVAGQVVCNAATDDAYQGAMDELNMWGSGDAVSHGFSLSYFEAENRRRMLDGNATSAREISAPLTAAWHRAINQRLKEQP